MAWQTVVAAVTIGGLLIYLTNDMSEAFVSTMKESQKIGQDMQTNADFFVSFRETISVGKRKD